MQVNLPNENIIFLILLRIYKYAKEEIKCITIIIIVTIIIILGFDFSYGADRLIILFNLSKKKKKKKIILFNKYLQAELITSSVCLYNWSEIRR
jgi:hypothetical protein